MGRPSPVPQNFTPAVPISMSKCHPNAGWTALRLACPARSIGVLTEFSSFLKKALSMALSSPNSSGNPSSGRLWHFGHCDFDETRYELRVHGRAVDLEVKPLEVLHQLLQRNGEVVSKEYLLEKVWPGVLVVDASLATAVSKL